MSALRRVPEYTRRECKTRIQDLLDFPEITEIITDPKSVLIVSIRYLFVQDVTMVRDVSGDNVGKANER